MTPIPTTVTDKKDAVLWSVLNSLEQIDTNANSRALWAQSLLFNISACLDGPAFGDEIRQIKEVLGIKEEPKPEVPVELTVAQEPRSEAHKESFIHDL